MRTSTNYYLIALAVADSIKLINDTFYFIVILSLNIDPPTGVAAYGIIYPYAHYLFSMSVCVTAWLTVSVAAERYIMVRTYRLPSTMLVFQRKEWVPHTESSLLYSRVEAQVILDVK